MLLGFAALVFYWSEATLAADSTALAKVKAQPFAGTVESVQVRGPDGQPIPVSVRDGRLTPLPQLSPDEQVSVEVVIRRPGWLAWALGHRRTERLTLRTPVAQVRDRWLTVERGTQVRLQFDQPVAAVAAGTAGRLRPRRLEGDATSVSLGRRRAAGSLEVAAAARAWERLGPPATVSWFPPAHVPVMVSSPVPGGTMTPDSTIRLVFSKPVDKVLGSTRPTLSPQTPGRWSQTDSHTLVFTPSGLGLPFATNVRISLPHSTAVVAATTHGLRTTSTVAWTVPSGSLLRLQQLLAQAGYLPLSWQPSGAPVANTPSAQLAAAVDPPPGEFTWRYPSTPPELRALWSAGQPNAITRGAVMTFEDEHDITVDGLPGMNVWHALLADTLGGKQRTAGYSYVYVHSTVPQSLTLWHDGQTILTSPGNTGVPAAPTKLGTFAVFEHIPIGTMSGTNPDGTHYHDPGIRWISYFNGGDAIHAFNRASFGTPQSLGCVELPLDAAAKVWPYTPIGTLVTVEK